VPAWLFKLATLIGLLCAITALLRWGADSQWPFALMYGLIFAACGVVIASFVAHQNGER
jgi:hypothetical protein